MVLYVECVNSGISNSALSSELAELTELELTTEFG